VSETVTVIITPDPIADAGGEKFIDCTNSVAQIGGDNTSTGADFTYSWTNAAGDEVGTTATVVYSSQTKWVVMEIIHIP